MPPSRPAGRLRSAGSAPPSRGRGTLGSEPLCAAAKRKRGKAGGMNFAVNVAQTSGHLRTGEDRPRKLREHVASVGSWLRRFVMFTEEKRAKASGGEV